MSSRESIQASNGASELPGWSLKQIVHVDAEHGYPAIKTKWLLQEHNNIELLNDKKWAVPNFKN